MKQAIPGLSISQQREATALVVWPSVSATAAGRFLGRLYEMRWGVPVFNLGTLFLVLSIPVALPLYLANFLPGVGTRYRITNRRIAVQRGLGDNIQREIGLDQFDRIEIEQRPGQAWFRAGDLCFFEGDRETFHLAGVPYPQVFRTACLKGSMTFRGFRDIHAAQAVPKEVPAKPVK